MGDTQYTDDTTLRDRFAGQAMASLVVVTDRLTFVAIAKDAYGLADAMLKERGVKGSKDTNVTELRTRLANLECVMQLIIECLEESPAISANLLSKVEAAMLVH